LVHNYFRLKIQSIFSLSLGGGAAKVIFLSMHLKLQAITIFSLKIQPEIQSKFGLFLGG